MFYIKCTENEDVSEVWKWQLFSVHLTNQNDTKVTEAFWVFQKKFKLYDWKREIFFDWVIEMIE